MSVIGKPEIKEMDEDKEKEDFTCVTFEPDLKKFKMKSLDDDTVALLSKRVYDLAGTTPASIKVYLNNKRLT
jgi:DNA topoisomerase II